MDQIKDILRGAVKYRFWIAVGISALLPLIAYFAGSGPIKAEALKAETEDKAAYDDVQKYRSPGLPNDQYKPIADKKLDVLNHDVNTAWRDLYNRQAPLLTWPTSDLQDYFRSWGRKWPEGVDPNLVQNVIIEYVNAYPDFVDVVYNSVAPWKAVDPTEAYPELAELAKKDPEKAEELKKKAEAGTGLVAAPPKEVLLKPKTATVFNTTTPPTLGQVWEAQEKLWVQGALLDVIAKVNAKAKAKDWESAPVKQITLLEIGSETAQDQQSLAKGETLVEPEDLVQPGMEAAVEVAPADSSGMMGEMSSMYGGMGGATVNDRARFIQPEGGQYRVYPVSLSVLVDQNYVQNLLVEFENSPMAIQVKDFEMQRPKARVAKPQAGQTLGFGSMGGYAGMMGSSYSQPYMMSSDMMSSTGMMGSGMYGGMGGSYPSSSYGMGMGMGGMAKPSTAKDIRTKTKAKDALALAKAKTKTEAAKVELYDPYYNIVEVHVYGQARFYNPPPPVEEPAPDSEGMTAEGTPAEGTPAEAGAPETPGTPPPASAAEPAAPAPAAAAPAAPEPAPAAATPPTPPPAGEANPQPPPEAAKAPAEAPKAESEAPKP